MQSDIISLHFFRREVASLMRIQWRVLRDITSKIQANNEKQCKTSLGRGKMRRKIMEKPSVPMMRLVIRKRAEKTAM